MNSLSDPIEVSTTGSLLVAVPKIFLLSRQQPDGEDRGRIWWNNVTLKIEDCSNAIDLSNVEYTAPRWGRFLREYVPPAALQNFLKECLSCDKSQEKLFYFAQGAIHKQGNCLIAMTYHPGMITLYSRSNIWLPTAALDLSIVGLVGGYISSRKEEVGLTWNISQLQFHATTTLPWLPKIPYLNQLREHPGKFQSDLVKQFDAITKQDVSKIKYKRMARMVKHTQRLVNNPITPWSYIPTLLEGYLP